MRELCIAGLQTAPVPGDPQAAPELGDDFDGRFIAAYVLNIGHKAAVVVSGKWFGSRR